VCFKGLASFIITKDSALGRATIFAFPVYPAMLYISVPNISLGIIELRDGKFAIRVFGAIYAAPGEQARQFRDGNGVKLFMKDMVDALLQVWDLRLKAHNQALGDLTQKYSCLTGRVYKNAVFDTNRKSLLRHISAEKGLK
jgi:hypothetical protein